MNQRLSRRRVIRLSLFAALCLLLGAATTVGVAWGIAWIGPLTERRSSTRLTGAQAEAAGWPDSVPSSWPRPTSSSLTEMCGMDVASADDAASDTSADDGPTGNVRPRTPDSIWVERYGEPLRALQLARGQINGTKFGDPPKVDGWTFDSSRSGVFWIRETPDSYSMTEFPLRPVWPGFVADTAL